MDDVGGPNVLGDFDGGAAEFGVALGVVGKVSAAGAVDSVAIEVRGVFQEQILHTVQQRSAANRRETQAQAHGDSDAGKNSGITFRAAVTREEHGDLVTLLHEGLGKRLEHVGETAGFGKRQAFGSYEKDSHARRGPRRPHWYANERGGERQAAEMRRRLMVGPGCVEWQQANGVYGYADFSLTPLLDGSLENFAITSTKHNVQLENNTILVFSGSAIQPLQKPQS